MRFLIAGDYATLVRAPGSSGPGRMRAMTTAIYSRLSMEHEDLGSLTTQEEECRRYAAFKQWNTIEVYRENGVSSGRGGDHRRKVFKQLVADVESGKVDHVLFYRVDRCYRIALGLLKFVELCREKGVDLCFTSQGIDTSIKGTGQLLITILGAIAEAESEIRSGRQKDWRKRERDAGRDRKGGRRKYGYEVDNVTQRPAEVALIRESAQRIVAGESLRSVAIRWQEAGITNTRGNEVVPQTLRRVLLTTDLVDAETREKLI